MKITSVVSTSVALLFVESVSIAPAGAVICAVLVSVVPAATVTLPLSW